MIDQSCLGRAVHAAQRAESTAGIVIRPLRSMADMIQASAHFDLVWDRKPGEPVEMQPALLRALEHSGSYVVGAYRAEKMIAASVAFLAAPVGRGLHSHITGVLPGRSGSGVGAALKWHQRAWALERGIDTVTWTYDPLVARNSYFNIARLGARPLKYLVDFYGLMPDGLNAGQPSDRILAEWELTSDAVESCAAGRQDPARSWPELIEDGGRVVLAQATDGEPVTSPDRGAKVTLVRVPADIEAIRRAAPALAFRWREALRSALLPLLQDPTRQVGGFLRSGWYVFYRNEMAAS